MMGSEGISVADALALRSGNDNDLAEMAHGGL